jgi:hypothetical protein
LWDQDEVIFRLTFTGGTSDSNRVGMDNIIIDALSIPPKGVLTFIDVSASHNDGDAPLTIDGDYSTTWSYGSVGAYITYTLSSPADVSSVGIA